MKSVYRYCLLTGWLLLGILHSVFAQTEEIQIRIYGFEEGLSHRNVFKIQQDTNGFLWFATVNGLNKYDGYEFTHFGEDEGPNPLFEAFISDIVFDPENQLWVAHPNFLSIMDPASGRVRQIPLNPRSTIRGEEHTPAELATTADGNAWMVTYIEKTAESYLQQFSPEGNLIHSIPLPGNEEVRPMLLSNDQLYVGGFENEVWLLNTQGERIDQFNFGFRGTSPSASRVTDITRNASGRIFLLLNSGEVYREKKQGGFELHPISYLMDHKSFYNHLLVEDDGDIWMAGEEHLCYYQASNNKLVDFNTEIQEITRYPTTYRQIFQDQSGVVWVASNFGAIKIVRSKRLFTNYLNGGNTYCSSGYCSMRGMTEDEEGNVYFTYYNSIHKLLPDGTVEPLFKNRNFINSPFGLVYHKDHLITGNGLKIHLKTEQIDTLFNGRNNDQGIPMIDSRNKVWIGFKNKLYQYDEDQEKTVPYIDSEGLLDSFPYTISYLHEGQRSGFFWIGTTEAGVFQLDLDSGQLRPFPFSEKGRQQLGHPRVLTLYEDNNGTLWVGTASGLTKIDLVSSQLRTYLKEDGLPNDFVNGILSEGDSCLWISTDNGLSRMVIQSDRFNNFFRRDGLPANEFNRISFFKSRNGTFYFGGLNGITSFQPGPDYGLRRKRQDRKLLFTYFSKYDGDKDSIIKWTTSLSEAEGIRLSYQDKFFIFGFALADYASPRENLYSYKLEGYENSWSEPTTNNSAKYNNIPAGRYTFKVRAATAEEDWNEEVLSVPVFIEQAYYKSSWFIALCLGTLILLVYGIMRLRIYQFRKRQKQLEDQVRIRTIELEHEKKKSEDLLLNILPAETAEELKANGTAKAKRYDHVTVMFTDFKGFTKIAEKLEPEDLVAEVDYCFRAFDEIIELYGLEKIKTIGDAYLCVGGLTGSASESARQVVKAALEIQAFMKAIAFERTLKGTPYFETRIGIHTGPIVAGIVGIKKFAYDIWGDTVNIASHLESKAEVGKVNVSSTTHSLVEDHFQCKHRGKITAKNKGEVDMYYVEGVL